MKGKTPRFNSPKMSSDSDQQEQPSSLKLVQDTINFEHPFGLKLWKPALYRKHRSIDAKTYAAFHSIPGSIASLSLSLRIANACWTLLFGWWIALIYIIVAFCMAILMLPGGNMTYPKLLLQLAWYIFFPFGTFYLHRQIHRKDKTSLL
jgi:Ca2+:H+ antiporter